MSGPGGSGILPLAPFLAFLAFYAAERSVELLVSARHVRRLLARGAREAGRSHFPVLVVLHSLFPFALAAEVLVLRARPGAFAPAWFALWLAAQVLRWVSVRALGGRWTTRVLVLPGEAPVRRGPYRWLAHPNYLAVVTELLAGPLMLGAWRTAIVFSLVNLPALWVRIRCEERALAEAASEVRAGA